LIISGFDQLPRTASATQPYRGASFRLGLPHANSWGRTRFETGLLLYCFADVKILIVKKYKREV
jgi:hypothetical protein